MDTCAAVRAEPKTVSDFVKDTKISSDNITSSHSEETCYNLFLQKHNLPLLLKPQTLKSFTKHLRKQSFPYPYKISINIITLETHIYLSTKDKLLPNHILLLPNQFPIYYDSSIKSSYNDYQKNNTLSFATTSQIDNSMSSNSSTLNLNIVTHNVQGYNTPTKRQLWEEFCLKNNLHIISITETKISSSKSKKFLNTPQFTYFWSSLDNSAEGTGIMINNSLKSHIHNIHTHPGGAIAVDLFFKHDFKFRIISVYLSSTNQQYRNQTQDKVISWIQQALSLNLHPIILGDFNAPIPLISQHLNSNYYLISITITCMILQTIPTIYKIPGNAMIFAVVLITFGHMIQLFLILQTLLFKNHYLLLRVIILFLFLVGHFLLHYHQNFDIKQDANVEFSTINL